MKYSKEKAKKIIKKAKQMHDKQFKWLREPDTLGLKVSLIFNSVTKAYLVASKQQI